MSYHRAPLMALGGDSCPQSGTITQMQQKLDELTATWQPTGYYTWQEMADLVDATVKLAGQASTMATQFYSGTSTPSAKDRVRAAYTAYNSVAERAMTDYLPAWKDAKAKGQVIDAPGFRQWVLDDLAAAIKLMRTVELEVCNTPWLVGVLVGISKVFIGVTDIAKRIGNVVLSIGENAVKAVERGGAIVGFLISIAPYAGIGLGAYLLYQKYGKRRS